MTDRLVFPTSGLAFACRIAKSRAIALPGLMNAIESDRRSTSRSLVCTGIAFLISGFTGIARRISTGIARRTSGDRATAMSAGRFGACIL
jgi:hypothetical protein